MAMVPLSKYFVVPTLPGGITASQVGMGGLEGTCREKFKQVSLSLLQR
jgi:hypothetical protein